MSQLRLRSTFEGPHAFEQLSGEPASHSLLALLEEYLDRVESDLAFDRVRWGRLACESNPELADAIRDGISQIDALTLLSGGVPVHTPQIPGYQILRRIGHGGVGVVYEAIEQSLDRRVALKVFPAAMDTSSKAHARFLIEAQAAARLDHPGIVPIYRIGADPGAGTPAFLCMKLIDGESLDRVVAERTSWCSQPSCDHTNHAAFIGSSVRWIIEAAEAIADAHSCGVIHRDIKPSNLMVDRDDRLWVTDFGLARLATGQSDVSLTQTGDRVGTMAYMSPQQAAGEPVDGRTDVYSLGLTLFELLCGSRAIGGETVGDVQTVRDQTDCFHVRDRIAWIPRDLDTIIAKATSRDVADRYQSAMGFAEDLRRFQCGTPIMAKPRSIADRSAKWLMRHRRFCAFIATVMVFATTASWAVMASLTIANQRTKQALEDSQSNLRRSEEVLDRFGLLAAERLRDVAGAEAVRHELLKQTLLYYQDYANRIDGDSHFIEQNAVTHFKAGQIIDEIGANADAISAYQASARLFDDAESLSPLGQKTQALTWNNLAVLKAEAGEMDIAVDLYQRAILRLSGTELARSLGNYAVTMIQAGDRWQAADLIQRGLRVLDDGDDDSDAVAVRAMLVSQWTFLTRGQPESLESCNQTIDLLRGNRQTDNGLADDRSTWMLATALANRAAITHDPSDLRESLALLDTVRPTFENDRLFLSDLATRQNDLGRLLLNLKDARNALKWLLAAEATLTELCRRDQQAGHYRIALAGVLHNLGRAYAIVDDKPGALAYFDRSVTIQKQFDDGPEQHTTPFDVARNELLRQTIADMKRVERMR
ncbi:Serine/threonine-protein kinase PknB [Rubripirellula lacrimiformis]|uniref:Serine/threonine-protein kinase PknB n=1 Tax=Rubripirellula lacrimiformis TaxID=1930273 RepID=A0A517NCZ8_9BACT|nr:serine/threonine-protein kinase [Rubripirellula lacrimiformis]QDT04928.1 Serine/threonine-protein kinase PknB [Rubripirellula lacrimiformis]